MKKHKNMKSQVSSSRRIIGLIRDAHALLRSRFMSKAQNMGYSMPQFMVMYELTSAGDMTMHELNGRLKLPKSTVSRIVDQLVDKKMLKRIRPENNRRVVMLKATPSYIKGKMAIRNLVVEDIDKVLSHSKAKILLQALEELVESIK
ncbi:MAG: MarR family transcriptional regulator [bacterium]